LLKKEIDRDVMMILDSFLREMNSKTTTTTTTTTGLSP